jgi:hypothetical protein
MADSFRASLVGIYEQDWGARVVDLAAAARSFARACRCPGPAADLPGERAALLAAARELADLEAEAVGMGLLEAERPAALDDPWYPLYLAALDAARLMRASGEGAVPDDHVLFRAALALE